MASWPFAAIQPSTRSWRDRVAATYALRPRSRSSTLGRAENANPAATRLLHARGLEPVGTPLLDLPTPDTRPALSAAWMAAHTHLAGGRADIQIGPHRLEVRRSPVGAGPGAGVVTVARDRSGMSPLAEEHARLQLIRSHHFRGNLINHPLKVVRSPHFRGNLTNHPL